MSFKYIIFLLFNLDLYQIGSCKDGCPDNQQLHKQIYEIKNMFNDINIEELTLSGNNAPCKPMKTIFDIRFDSLPKNCKTDRIPRTCAEATECTCSTGIYNITNPIDKEVNLTVFCDMNNYGGDWLYILRRNDGTQNFNRTWKDYVNGFGNIAGEFWLGLENIYALTNFYGPQELFVFLESFKDTTGYARYDNFLIGSAKEDYKLESLGQYSGTAGDSLYRLLGSKFTTLDKDNDEMKQNCAEIRGGGFWFKNCTDANPTANYLRGSYSKKGAYNIGSYWKTFEGCRYSLKTIIFMIRRKNVSKFEPIAN
ncbi:angiopoietin-related protein 2-like [Lucilia cuprina]|uniref:angiopoietin-related protein 2-like n=1 Tax=Lucilia cuprina TaxID=7375 RepID=UPI001F058D1B|nr:angiopoietin-related protein 2-like [Lucilia cuprina]